MRGGGRRELRLGSSETRKLLLVLFGLVVLAVHAAASTPTPRCEGSRDGRESPRRSATSASATACSRRPLHRARAGQPVLAKAHHSFADGAHHLARMRLVLGRTSPPHAESQALRLRAPPRRRAAPPPPEQLLAQDVRVGDELLWYNAVREQFLEAAAAVCSSWRHAWPWSRGCSRNAPSSSLALCAGQRRRQRVVHALLTDEPRRAAPRLRVGRARPPNAVVDRSSAASRCLSSGQPRRAAGRGPYPI